MGMDVFGGQEAGVRVGDGGGATQEGLIVVRDRQTFAPGEIAIASWQRKSMRATKREGSCWHRSRWFSAGHALSNGASRYRCPFWARWR